jgi:hypothetical protein
MPKLAPALVLVEASYEPFYKGQRLFHELHELLRINGFNLIDSAFNMMHDPDTGRALQGDFLFIPATRRQDNG